MGSVRRWSVPENTKIWCSWQNADRPRIWLSGCMRTGHHFADRVIGARDRISPSASPSSPLPFSPFNYNFPFVPPLLYPRPFASRQCPLLLYLDLLIISSTDAPLLITLKISNYYFTPIAYNSLGATRHGREIGRSKVIWLIRGRILGILPSIPRSTTRSATPNETCIHNHGNAHQRVNILTQLPLTALRLIITK